MVSDKKINHEELRYESPCATLLYIQSEGVLCQSGEFDRADNGYDNDFDLGEI